MLKHLHKELRADKVLRVLVSVFLIGFVITLGLWVLVFLGHNDQVTTSNMYKVTFFAASLCSAATLSQFISCLVQFFIKKEGKHCPYQEHLEELGIEKIYKNRLSQDPSGTKGYVPDLLLDFKHLSRRHKKPTSPVKMMGVSLEFYLQINATLRGHEIAETILEKIPTYYFHALIAKTDNPELKRRDLYTNTYSSEDQQKLDSIRGVNESETIIQYKQTTHHDHIISKSYSCAPYATIIIINDSIYYTPNHIFDKDIRIDYTKLDLMPFSSMTDEPTLTLLIKRSSPLGLKIEAEFEAIWHFTDKEEKVNKFLQEFLQKINKKTSLFESVKSQQERRWIATAINRGIFYGLRVEDSSINVELGILGDNKEQTKHIFDKLFTRKDEIERHFGAGLDWQRWDDQEESSIIYSISVNEDGRHTEIETVVENMIKFNEAMEDATKK